MTSRRVSRYTASACAALAALVAPTLALALNVPAPATPVDDIRDIRPLISIPPWWYWLAAAAAATLIVALVYATVRYFRRRTARALSPEQRALQALNEAEAWARAGQCHEWAEVVARTLRVALATRLEQAACPETTSELSAIDWSKLPHGNAVDAAQLVALLSTCDLTRFALGRLDPNALLAETDAARAFIRRLFAAQETPIRAAAPVTTVEASP